MGISLKEMAPCRNSAEYGILPVKLYTQNKVDDFFFISHHWHEEVELIYIEAGEFMIFINGEMHLAKEGDVVFINANEIHQIAAATQDSIHHAIVFNPKIIRFEWHDAAQGKYLTPLMRGELKYQGPLPEASPLKGKIQQEFIGAVLAYQGKNESWPLLIKSALLKLIVLLMDANVIVSKAAAAAPRPREKEVLAQSIMTYIHEHYREKLTLEELSQISNLSIQYFCKFFKSMFGKTAVEFINDYRIEQAAQLLIHSSDKITSIAFAVGFDNSSYFIRKFKSLKGMTPSAYRLAHRLENQA